MPGMRGSLERAGEGSFEIVNLNLEIDDETRAALIADPEGAVRSFLESQGKAVNAVVVRDPSVDALARSGWYHIQVPESERSQWIQA